MERAKEKKATTAVEVYKREGGYICSKDVRSAVCHYCGNDELIVTDVTRLRINGEVCRSAVECGNCGLRGPWGVTEEVAMIRWNNMAGLASQDFSGWSCTHLSELRKNEAPF